MTNHDELYKEEELHVLKELSSSLKARSEQDEGIKQMLSLVQTIKGADGTDGVGIASIETKQSDEAVTFEVKMTNGSTQSFEVNVVKGKDGQDGASIPGKDGEDGKSATVKLGNVTYGDTPSIKNVGDEHNAILDIVLAKAIKPKPGKDGRDGVGFTWRGNWVAGVQYSKNDVVASEGSSYVALTNTRGQRPSTAAWGLVAQRGSDGANGISRGGSSNQSGGGGGGAVSSVAGRMGDVVLTKNDVQLSNVDNTADVDKPVSSAQATAISSAVSTKANDSSVVHVTGNEAIAGIKTFSDTPMFNTGIDLTAITAPAYQAGLMYFDSTEDAFTVYSNDANVSLNLGQEQYIRVMNSTASSIANGIPVYLSGATSGTVNITPAINTTLVGSQTIGLTTETIAAGAMGYVTVQGKVRNINTAAFTAGAAVYVGATAGALTSTIPANPAFIARVGIVLVSSATVGVILVSIEPPALFTAQGASVDIGLVLSNAGLRSAGTAYPLSTSGPVSAVGSVRFGVATVTAAITLTTSSVMNQMASAATVNYNITLPATTTAGYEFMIKKTDATAFTITVLGTIDGVTNYVLSTQYKYVRIISTAVSGVWSVVGNN